MRGMNVLSFEQGLAGPEARRLKPGDLVEVTVWGKVNSVTDQTVEVGVASIAGIEPLALTEEQELAEAGEALAVGEEPEETELEIPLGSTPMMGPAERASAPGRAAAPPPPSETTMRPGPSGLRRVAG